MTTANNQTQGNKLCSHQHEGFFPPHRCRLYCFPLFTTFVSQSDAICVSKFLSKLFFLSLQTFQCNYLTLDAALQPMVKKIYICIVCFFLYKPGTRDFSTPKCCATAWVYFRCCAAAWAIKMRGNQSTPQWMRRTTEQCLNVREAEMERENVSEGGGESLQHIPHNTLTSCLRVSFSGLEGEDEGLTHTHTHSSHYVSMETRQIIQPNKEWGRKYEKEIWWQQHQCKRFASSVSKTAPQALPSTKDSRLNSGGDDITGWQTVAALVARWHNTLKIPGDEPFHVAATACGRFFRSETKVKPDNNGLRFGSWKTN